MSSQEQNFLAVGFSLPDSKFKKRKKNLSSIVYVRVKKKTAKKCIKKCDAGAKLLICLLNLLLFMFSLHLKLANLSVLGGDGPGGGSVVLCNHFARPP